MRGVLNREALSWAMYDWANSAYATAVMAGFFPVFFKQYWASGLSANMSTLHLGMANSLASVLIAALAPLLGAIADHAGTRKLYLLIFTSLGVVMTGALYLVGEGHWIAAITLYILATIGFMGGNLFYDALLLVVAPRKLDMVSALGYAAGYLGGGLLFAATVFMVMRPELFGLQDSAAAIRLSYLLVALWWAVFSLPLWFFVHEEKESRRDGYAEMLTAGFRRLLATVHEIRRYRNIVFFLFAYWMYIDGVNTVVRMAVDYGLALGFSAQDLILALLLTQFVGFPAALLFGKLGESLGAKAGIYLAIAIYLVVTGWAAFIRSADEFYLLAVMIGLVQGGIQALSRSLYGRLIPRRKTGEFFGFYNMLGKFATVVGPVAMGWISVLSGNPRMSLLAIIALFLAGASVLYFVRTGPTEDPGRVHSV